MRVSIIPAIICDMTGLTQPYVSRIRSSIAQYIKEDNDGERTAGTVQPWNCE